MKKETMVLYLGYAALALIGIYFTFGILKVSGEGLAKLGYENNFIREGFNEREEKEMQEKLEKKVKQGEQTQKFIDDIKDRMNATNDMDEYGEVVEIEKNTFDTVIRMYVQAAMLAKDNGEREANLKIARTWKQDLDLINDYTI
jgi:hypothetical protein